MVFLNLQWSPCIPQVSLFIRDPLLGLLQPPVPTPSLSISLFIGEVQMKTVEIYHCTDITVAETEKSGCITIFFVCVCVKMQMKFELTC